MSWYRAELISGNEQLRLLLGDSPTKEEIKDYFSTEDFIHPLPVHLSSLNHHPLIKNAFRHVSPIPATQARFLRYKPEGTFTSGLYMASDRVTALRERLNHILTGNGMLAITLFVYDLDYLPNLSKNIFDIETRDIKDKSILYHKTDYISCNNLFDQIAIDQTTRKPNFNVVDYVSVRNPPQKNNLVYDIRLLGAKATNVTPYQVLQNNRNVIVSDVTGNLLFQFSI
ncbi:MAG: hypothetical protein AB7I27_13670 [Bacteriovoracaceae bacterium]